MKQRLILHVQCLFFFKTYHSRIWLKYFFNNRIQFNTIQKFGFHSHWFTASFRFQFNLNYGIALSQFFKQSNTNCNLQRISENIKVRLVYQTKLDNFKAAEKPSLTSYFENMTGTKICVCLCGFKTKRLQLQGKYYSGSST